MGWFRDILIIKYVKYWNLWFIHNISCSNVLKFTSQMVRNQSMIELYYLQKCRRNNNRPKLNSTLKMFTGSQDKYPNDSDKGVPLRFERPPEPEERGGRTQNIQSDEHLWPSAVFFGPLTDPRRKEESLHNGRRIKQGQRKLALWKVKLCQLYLWLYDT